MYEHDTFFHLSLLGRVGVVVIAVMLGAITLWLCARLSRHLRPVSAVLLALGLFVVFEWLSPQVFYLWYLAVIEGLPVAWIAGYWPRPGPAMEVLLFQVPGSLSAHGRAGLGWALIALALIVRRRRDPSPDPGPWAP